MTWSHPILKRLAIVTAVAGFTVVLGGCHFGHGYGGHGGGGHGVYSGGGGGHGGYKRPRRNHRYRHYRGY
jgi:hypothetical protein